MCKHKHKNYEIPLVLNFTPRKMKVKWQCTICGERGTENKMV